MPPFSLNDLMTPLNGVVEGLLRSRFHFLASKHLMLITWSGRQSGQPFSIPAGYQYDGDAIFVTISQRDEKNWWKNFRSPWPADLHIRGKIKSTFGEVIPPSSPEFFDYCERTLTRLPWMGSQFGGIEFDKQTGLTDEQRRILEEHVGAVRFDPLD